MNKSIEKAAQKATLAAKPHRRFFNQVVGYVVALACLFWVFHDLAFRAVLGNMARIRWEWMAVAVVCDVLSYLSQGWRWQLLLKPLGKINVIETTRAIYVGLLTNEIIPLRMGELVRLYLVSRRLAADFIAVLPSYLVERLFDGLWLALTIGLAILFVPLPRDLIVAEEILGGLVLALAGLFLYIVLRQKSKLVTRQAPGESRWRPLRFFSGLTRRMASGLAEIGASADVYASFAASSLILIFQIFALWFAMLGFNLSISLWSGAVVLLILHIGTAIPNAPSNIGSYQFFTVLGLTLFNVDKTIAASFSVVAFLVLTFPLWGLGLIALRSTRMTFAELRKEIARVRQRTSPEPH